MMLVVHEERVKSPRKVDEVEQIKRLIRIQKQIVDLAKQNELAARECEALRRELAEEFSRSWWRRLLPVRFVRAFLEKLKTAVSGKSNA